MACDKPDGGGGGGGGGGGSELLLTCPGLWVKVSIHILHLIILIVSNLKLNILHLIYWWIKLMQ